MTEKILFVDDEPNILNSIKRGLRKKYDIDTATSGCEALEMLEVSGPYAVVVSDMQMPEMNGAEFLAIAKVNAPETVRIMLTGNADQQTAIDAINHGDILRFLNKPSNPDQISLALEAGLIQHRLIIAEREILENTLRASVAAVVEVLSLANPELFGRSMRLKNRILEIGGILEIKDTWQLETTALLSQIGCVSIPIDIVKKKVAGFKLLPEEQSLFSTHTSLGADILERIPRMEEVALNVRYQDKYYDGSGYPQDAIAEDAIPYGSRIMRVLLDFDSREMEGHSRADAFARLKSQAELYDPQILTALGRLIEFEDDRVVISLAVAELKEGMEIATGVVTIGGQLLIVAKGQKITESVLRHLHNYKSQGSIESKVEVWQKAGDVDLQAA